METTNGRITVKLTLYEAAMVKKLRNYQFGSFTIHKIKGEPRRVEIGGSEMLSDKEGRDLAI